MAVTAAHIGAGSQQAKPLFVEIGLNYSVDCASLRAFRSKMSNFLLLAHSGICLPRCEHILDLPRAHARELRNCISDSSFRDLYES